jgi:hypothetical protein
MEGWMNNARHHFVAVMGAWMGAAGIEHDRISSHSSNNITLVKSLIHPDD